MSKNTTQIKARSSARRADLLAESDAAFSKAFNRVVGASPGEYLKRGFKGQGNAGMAEDF
jgi:hypothetical protein